MTSWLWNLSVPPLVGRRAVGGKWGGPSSTELVHKDESSGWGGEPLQGSDLS